jgi:hypothetical protein
MHDPDSGVRNNAARALLVFTYLAPKPPRQKIKVPTRPFVELLNSCIWTDRNKSSAALGELTEQRDPVLLKDLQETQCPL